MQCVALIAKQKKHICALCRYRKKQLTVHKNDLKAIFQVVFDILTNKSPSGQPVLVGKYDKTLGMQCDRDKYATTHICMQTNYFAVGKQSDFCFTPMLFLHSLLAVANSRQVFHRAR